MLIQLQPQHLTILGLKLDLLAVEVWIVLVDKSAVVVHLITFFRF